MANATIMTKNAYAYYASMASPGSLKYQQKADDKNPLINKEYVVELVLPVKDLKILKKKWAKAVKLLRESKFYTAAEFEKRFKVAPPADSLYETLVEEIDDDDNEYEVIKYETIKLRKHASYQDGNATRLVQLIGSKNKQTVDRNGVAITQELQDKDGEIIGGVSTLIGNGSLVTLQSIIRPLTNVDGNQSQFDLHKIQVLELVEYVSAEVEDGDFEDDDSDFDNDTDDGDFEDDDTATTKAADPEAGKNPEDDQDDDF